MATRTWRIISGLSHATDLLLQCAPGDPFLHPHFLRALEDSGVVGAGTAWEPVHLLCERDGQAAALLPLYRKHDSRGEYVFDHAWAAAYERHHRAYYPKLVTAIPFSPVVGPRLLLARGETTADWLPFVLNAVRDACAPLNCSGWHGLFLEEEWLLAAQHEEADNADKNTPHFALREGCRFHWRNENYQCFDDFLNRLTSKKRKDLKRERRRLHEQGIHCHALSGHDIHADHWQFFYECYERTYHEHGQYPYLNRDFFQKIAATMPEHLLMVVAEDSNGLMASALFLHDTNTLYGRYWGCLRRADGLHFEVCYYAGMEFCIRHHIRNFDPGTQGEHKLLRGFAPQFTHSLHYLQAPDFHHAIQQFAHEEREAVRHYHASAARAVPYKEHKKED